MRLVYPHGLLYTSHAVLVRMPNARVLESERAGCGIACLQCATASENRSGRGPCSEQSQQHCWIAGDVAARWLAEFTTQILSEDTLGQCMAIIADVESVRFQGRLV